VDHGQWRVIDTLHFRIHFPTGLDSLAERAALYAEQAHARLSRVMGHRMGAAIPIFLFASHQDFAAANFFPGSPGEGTGGFTDFSRRRVVVPFNGDYAALRHVLAHEIVHAFQFDILPGPFYSAYPLWMIEGMAEYLSLGWDSSAETYVRDLVLHGRLPGLGALQAGSNRSAYDNYKVGQALFWFAARKYGEKRIGFFLKEIAATGDLRAAFRSAFHTTPEEFDFAFAADLNARYAPAFRQLARERQDPDPRLRVASFRYHAENHRSDASGFHLHPVIAPDGRRMAYITASGPFPALAIKAVPGPGVRQSAVDDVTIVLKALRSSDYESYQPLTTRLSWSPDGRRLLVAGRHAGRAALLLIDIAGEEIVASWKPPFSGVHHPIFASDGRRVLFTGVVRGQADLFVLDTALWTAVHDSGTEIDAPDDAAAAGAGLLRLTRDRCYEADAGFARDDRGVYFSSNCGMPFSETESEDHQGPPPFQGDRIGRHIFRVEIPSGVPGPNSDRSPPPISQITRIPGSARHPQQGVDGGLIFSSDFTGVRNMYRIPARVLADVEGSAAAQKQSGEPGESGRLDSRVVGSEDLIALTRSATGIEHAALTIVPRVNPTDSSTPPDYIAPPPGAGEYLAFTERAEGALELKVLPPGIAADGRAAAVDSEDDLETRKITAVALLAPGLRSFDPAAYQMPIATLIPAFPWQTSPGETSPQFLSAPYQPALSFDGLPYLFVGGGTDANGETRIAGLAVAQLADDTGDHQVFGLAGYGESPPEWTFDLRYSYLRHRPDFFVGGFRESGAFPVASFFDLNLNHILYDPNFRVLDQETYGVYGGVEYPLSKFSSLSTLLEAGREEILFRGRESDQREQDDIAAKYYSAGLAFRYSNAVYGPYGPLDGQGLLLSYTIPLRLSGREREVYVLIGDYRLHHWFSNESIFAARAFAGGVGGQDALDYPFRLGGYATIRGYDFQSFAGRYAFFANLEYRFPLIKYLLFGFPFDWSPGWIRGVLFFDGGAAFDKPGEWQAYESRTRATRDLYLSYGAGIHFENLLWFLFPGVVMKVEWATPYDLKVSEPPRKWRGVFSIGVNF
jgi:hypothetical protein